MIPQDWEKIRQDLIQARMRMQYRHWRPDLFGLPPAGATAPVSVEEALASAKTDPNVLILTPEDAKMLIEMGIDPTQ